MAAAEQPAQATVQTDLQTEQTAQPAVPQTDATLAPVSSDSGQVQSQEAALQNRTTGDTGLFDYDTAYAGIADRDVQELIGMDVLSTNGEDVGEVDRFARIGDQLVAIVGIGGFLGMGEHNVALQLDRMMMQNDALVVQGYTEEQLKALPEFDESQARYLESGTRLRDGWMN